KELTLNRKRSFFDDENLSDVIIKFGEKRIFAHRVILARGSVWFEKALLGDFSEANKKAIELFDDTVPDASMAMFKHLYGMSYNKQEYPRCDEDLPEFHLDVFILGDKYDVPCLRLAARKVLQEFMGDDFQDGDFGLSSILVIQKLLGPDAAQFADRSLELHIEEEVLSHAVALMCDKTFRSALARGKMLKPSIADKFMEEITKHCN
ncbi:hypothetical protein D6D19_10685, partial [Aureobasidium pullulans]